MNWKFWEKNDDPFGGSDDPFAGLDDFSSSADSSSQPAASQQPDFSGQFSPPPSEPTYSAPPSQQAPAQQPSSSGRDLQSELVLSKLDAIRNQLENVVARLDRLEEASRRRDEQRSSGGSSAQQRGPWYAKQ